jgi:hypothetical protein
LTLVLASLGGVNSALALAVAFGDLLDELRFCGGWMLVMEIEEYDDVMS